MAKSSKHSKVLPPTEPPSIESTLSPTNAGTARPAPTIEPTVSPTENRSTSAPTLEGTSKLTGCLPAPDRVEPVSCIPTTGSCIQDATTLTSAINAMADSDIVAICGNVATSNTLRATASQATLCCGSVDKNDCVLGSLNPPGHPILVVTGRDFVLSGIRFRGGFSSRGGHVAIAANGDHLIEDCSFDGGVAQQDGNDSGYGGNVFVQTNNSLTVRRSEFLRGQASAWGGGLAVFDAAKLHIEDSWFANNEAGIGG